MSRKNTEKHEEIVALAKLGKTSIEIGAKFKITKARVGQILNLYNIDPRAVRRNQRLLVFNEKKNNIELDLNSGLSVNDIRLKYALTCAEINELYNFGINLKLVDRNEIEKRRKFTDKLYKKGLTAYEIMDIIPRHKVPTDVYKDVCHLNEGHLPKRKNTSTIKSEKLTKLIKGIASKHTLRETCDILNEKGVTNLYGGKMKFGALLYRYYKK